MEYLYAFYKNLKNLRLQYKYTQKQVAEKLGIKYQSYQNYERGITIPTLLHFFELADIFDISLDEFVNRK